MYKKISELVLQKAQVEAEIRAVRVRTIRTVVFKLARLNDPVITDLIEKMEAMLAGVVYSYNAFDDILDNIEARLNLG